MSTKEHIKQMVADLEALEVFKTVIYKEPWETEKGIKDHEAPGVYVIRDGGSDNDEEWDEQTHGCDNAMYKVIGQYRAVAWFYKLDAEKVANTLIVALQSNKGTVRGVSYNPRLIYLEESLEEIRSDLVLVRVSFTVQTLISARACKSDVLCKEDIC